MIYNPNQKNAGIRPYRNQAEGEEAGGGRGRAASSRTATDSIPPSGGGRGGAPSPQLEGSPELPNQGSPMASNRNPQELAPEGDPLPKRLRIRGACPGYRRSRKRKRRGRRELCAANARGRKKRRQAEAAKPPITTKRTCAAQPYSAKFIGPGPSRPRSTGPRNICASSNLAVAGRCLSTPHLLLTPATTCPPPWPPDP
jgi:hypothetical protein